MNEFGPQRVVAGTRASLRDHAAHVGEGGAAHYSIGVGLGHRLSPRDVRRAEITFVVATHEGCGGLELVGTRATVVPVDPNAETVTYVWDDQS